MTDRRRRVGAAALSLASLSHAAHAANSNSNNTAAAAASGLRIWVDPKTPGANYVYTSSRGAQWELVMSDEFDTPGRSFLPGSDHVWTAIESPDGVNAALEYYAIQHATTECADSGAVCYLKLKVLNEPFSTSVWNGSKSPPGMETVTFNYQSAMVQSWNKFCFQGGMVEVRVKLPGAVSADSTNPDVANGAASRVKTGAFYPTWPGVWMMGNLGRALFSQSTNRMWPYSYSQCEPDVFDPANQRISACDSDPGHGLNARQGRGAPEIDILEGGGLDITSSLQIAPGMPTDFRRVEGEYDGCYYKDECKTLGANDVGVPTETYAARGHKSWYQGLRYASNPFCAKNASDAQTLATVEASLAAGVSANQCDVETCPASLDVHSDLGYIDGAGDKRWGVNADGSCFAQMNVYQGALLCSAGNSDAECVKQAGEKPAPVDPSVAPFKYRLDALSANWPIHLAMYTDFLAYQVEWVPGSDGYIRWMLEGSPIFEIPAAAVTTPPQDAKKSNPTKLLPEEPMYLIFNVAVSSAWTAMPPNAPRACRDHGTVKDADVIGYSELICDQFPMDLKIDYVRVYQDLSSASRMSVGCDPASHPTRQWIEDHMSEYQNDANPAVAVAGLGFCVSDADCTLATETTGFCRLERCYCTSLQWTGPRCNEVNTDDSSGRVVTTGPPANNQSGSGSSGTPVIAIVAIAVGSVVLVVGLFFLAKRVRARRGSDADSDAGSPVYQVRRQIPITANELAAYPRDRPTWPNEHNSPAAALGMYTIHETASPESSRRSAPIPHVSPTYQSVLGNERSLIAQPD